MTARRLSPDETALILRLARAALEQAVTGRPVLERMLETFEPVGALAEHRGAFVSLHTRPAAAGSPAPLRGCIGLMDPDRPLYRTVAEMARAAAQKDPRFEPVQAAELPGLAIDVSVLTPLTPVNGPDDFHPGPDGVQIELRGRRAVFLPQVARDEGWSREVALRHLCMKAGLGPEDWRDPEARLATFQAEVIAEPGGPSS